jgi:hypothetical protein
VYVFARAQGTDAGKLRAFDASGECRSGTGAICWRATAECGDSPAECAATERGDSSTECPAA